MPRFQARLSDEAHRGWERVATNHGITYSALLEALGQALDEGTYRIPEVTIEAARAIDVDRRNR